MKSVLWLLLTLFAIPLMTFGDEAARPDTWSEVYLEEVRRADAEYECAFRAANKTYFDFLKTDPWYEPRDKARATWLSAIAEAKKAWRARKERLWYNHAACIHEKNRAYNEAAKQADARYRVSAEVANQNFEQTKDREAWHRAIDDARLRYVSALEEAWNLFVQQKTETLSPPE